MSADAQLIHVCSFSTFEMKKRTTYAELKAAVLEAGRFSVFDATESPRSARFYERLCKDPEIRTVKMPFPWTGVKRRRKKR